MQIKKTRHINRHENRCSHVQIYSTIIHIDRQIYRHTDAQTDRQIGRKIDKNTQTRHRKIDRQIDTLCLNLC